MSAALTGRQSSRPAQHERLVQRLLDRSTGSCVVLGQLDPNPGRRGIARRPARPRRRPDLLRPRRSHACRGWWRGDDPRSRSAGGVPGPRAAPQLERRARPHRAPCRERTGTGSRRTVRPSRRLGGRNLVRLPAPGVLPSCWPGVRTAWWEQAPNSDTDTSLGFAKQSDVRDNGRGRWCARALPAGGPACTARQCAPSGSLVPPAHRYARGSFVFGVVTGSGLPRQLAPLGLHRYGLPSEFRSPRRRRQGSAACDGATTRVMR